MAIEQVQKALNQLQNWVNSDNRSEPTVGYLRALVIGSVAGTRSTLPLTLLTWEHDPRISDTLFPSRLLANNTARTIATLATAGEMIADKLPIIPSRLSPLPFIGRLFTGGLAGTIIAYRFGESPMLGALLGGTAAGFGTVAGYYSRQMLTEHTPIPGPVWGVLEDAIGTGLGLLAVKRSIPV